MSSTQRRKDAKTQRETAGRKMKSEWKTNPNFFFAPLRLCVFALKWLFAATPRCVRLRQFTVAAAQAGLEIS